jgi:acetyl-CoA carboxylase carboxyltransferase component
MSRRPKQKIYLDSLYHCECESGLDSITLRKRFNALGVAMSGKIALNDLCRALVTSKDAAMEAKLKAETKRIERMERVARGELCDVAKHSEIILAHLMQLRRYLEADYRAQGRLKVLDEIFKKHLENLSNPQNEKTNENQDSKKPSIEQPAS